MVFNNLLRKKINVSEVGGSNCQQPVSEKGQMDPRRHGTDINVVTSYILTHQSSINRTVPPHIAPCRPGEGSEEDATRRNIECTF